MELLQKQEAVHATETIKWQHIINSAIELLRKVKSTDYNLYITEYIVGNIADGRHAWRFAGFDQPH